MYPTSDEQIAVSLAEQLMVEQMSAFSDSSHDVYHVRRVRKTAMTIARALPTTPDLFIVEIAALLHDVLDKKYVPADVDPQVWFLPFFTSIASKTSIDLVADGRSEILIRVIENVSWSNEKKLRANGEWTKWHEECLELHCVQDADRLDAIGAFGVMRCAAYTALRNEPRHTGPDDPARSNSAIQHFDDKLVHIYDRLKTSPGKSLGQRRHKLIVDFIAAAKEEYEAN
ncbi:hypothetical protein C8J56DRAFT_779278 [Mycena floridula]|nr:hypothetical protein C8J56DRAFT_779278 [Mycena floridula]